MHTHTQQGAASWCSHWQDVSALDFTVPPSPSLCCRAVSFVSGFVFFFPFFFFSPCYFVSQCQHWLWWLIDLAGAAGFKTTTLAEAAQGNTEHAGWVNPRREETTLVICQLWESYHKLRATTFIVVKWEMHTEPCRSILNVLCCASALGPQSEGPFPFVLSCSSPTLSHQLQHLGSQKPPASGEKGPYLCQELRTNHLF